MKCPTCGCEKFFVKDPDDEYEIYTFTRHAGEVSFEPEVDPSAVPEVTGESETFCDRCAWHGKLKTL